MGDHGNASRGRRGNWRGGYTPPNNPGINRRESSADSMSSYSDNSRPLPYGYGPGGGGSGSGSSFGGDRRDSSPHAVPSPVPSPSPYNPGGGRGRGRSQSPGTFGDARNPSLGGSVNHGRGGYGHGGRGGALNPNATNFAPVQPGGYLAPSPQAPRVGGYPRGGGFPRGRGRGEDRGHQPQTPHINRFPPGRGPPRGQNAEESVGQPEMDLESEARLFDNQAIFTSKPYFNILKDGLDKITRDSNDLKIPCPREGFAQSDFTVYTNHFAVKLPETAIYQYQVIGMNSADKKAPPREKRKSMMDEFITSCRSLHLNRNDFATDGMSLIVSWVDLRPLFGVNFANAPPKTELFSQDLLLRAASKKNPGKYPEQKRTLKLMYMGVVPTNELIRASKGEAAHLLVEPQEEIEADANDERVHTISATHAINLIIARSTRATDHSVFQVGRNKLYLETEKEDIGSGLVAYKGFTSSLRVGMGEPLINVSLATTAFYSSIYVDEFLRATNRAGQAALVNVRVKVKYSGIIRTIRSFGEFVPTEQTFSLDVPSDADPNTITQKTISVYDYLHDYKQVDVALLERMAISEFPCANCGNDDHDEWFPVEALKIIKHQPARKVAITPSAVDKMIDVARPKPRPNLERIFTSGLRLLGVQTQNKPQSTLSKSGIKIEQKVLQIPARQVALPMIKYSQGSFNGSSWDLKNKQFLDTSVPFTGKLLVLAQYSIVNDHTNSAYNSAAKLLTQMSILGIDLNGREFSDIIEIAQVQPQNPTSFQSALDAAGLEPGKKNLVVFLNFDKSMQNSGSFDHFKRVVEQRYGYHSLCLAQAAIRKSKQPEQYMANVAMKVNIRLGNINHTFERPDGSSDSSIRKLFNSKKQLDTMILGADVTHTQKDSAAGSHSLAALVGSVDDTFGQFYGSMRYQKKDKEIIDDIYGMTLQRLEAFYQYTERGTGSPRHRAPTQILYYRDGVDNGQYYSVRKHEVQEIKRAWSDFSRDKNLPKTYPAEPKVTAVVVTKRHRTRFYPEVVPNPGNKENHNCKQGTCVDSGVTHPTFFDFYLQSHKPGPGTAKPTYYIVLENGMEYTSTELQDFTNWLCYTYVRTTLPVGYAPPTYYADRLCDRARCYFVEHLKPMKAEIEQAKRDRVEYDTEVRGEAMWLERYNDNADRNANGFIVGQPNNHGPWHRNLNDTMFWM